MSQTQVNATNLSPNPWQPRTALSDEYVRDLADSIHRVGLLQRPLVRKVQLTGRKDVFTYQIAFGHARVEAIRLLQNEVKWAGGVPVEVRELGDARRLPLVSVDSIITSPPWEDREATVRADKFADLETTARIMHENGLKSPNRHNASYEAILAKLQRQKGYTRPPQVDAVVTSPPYEQASIRDQAPYQGGAVSDRVAYMMRYSYRSGVHSDHTNIGNLRGTAYWSSMRQVYSQCYKVLRDGGIMALVLKGFTRDGKYVDLPDQTRVLCEELGFKLFDHWKRQLWSLSFWRILQKRRDPAAFDDRLNFEEVLAFRKV